MKYLKKNQMSTTKHCFKGNCKLKHFTEFDCYTASDYSMSILRGRPGRYRLVVGFTTSCAISAYHY